MFAAGKLLKRREPETPCPSSSAPRPQKGRPVKSLLRGLSERDRDLLVRFYLLEQLREQICREISLTQMQFRLLKSRTKWKLRAIWSRKLKLSAYFLDGRPYGLLIPVNVLGEE